jgi:hypothetical protein
VEKEEAAVMQAWPSMASGHRALVAWNANGFYSLLAMVLDCRWVSDVVSSMIIKMTSLAGAPSSIFLFLSFFLLLPFRRSPQTILFRAAYYMRDIDHTEDIVCALLRGA